jgi:F-type H+-transporting ATPase subunit c
MRKTISYMLLVMAVALIAAPAYAQATPNAADTSRVAMWVVITAGFAMAIASAVCGLGQAKATAAAAEALARNPAARPGIQLALILGLALIESLALYTLVIIFAKVSVPAYLQPK